MSGPGQMSDIKAEWNHSGWGTTFSVDLTLSLYNFDIDAPTLKDGHKTFLDKTVVPLLTTNKHMKLTLVGSASRSGPPDHNWDLSKNRAKALRAYLVSKGVDGQVGGQVDEPVAGGAPPGPGPKESDADRSVYLIGSFPVDLTDIEIYTDDWSRALKWDDIVGLGSTENRRIQQLNIQATVWGGNYAFMPDQFPLEANGTRAGRPIQQKTWLLSKGPAPTDPTSLWITYRISDSVNALGFTAKNKSQGNASITRSNVRVDLGLNGGNWADRGRAQQDDHGAPGYNRPDPMRLLDAGGVEVLSLTSPLNKFPHRTSPKWLLRSPASVFLYAGGANLAGCLEWNSNCWATPERVLSKWRSNSGMTALILVAPNILQMNFFIGFTAGGPGAKWALLLNAKAGPLTTILGYRDDAPSLFDVGAEIAEKMGAKIAGGLRDDEWAQAWLTVNGDHPGRNTWNAVAMDSKGYWWIEPWSTSKMLDSVLGGVKTRNYVIGKSYVIVGPVPIV